MNFDVFEFTIFDLLRELRVQFPSSCFFFLFILNRPIQNNFTKQYFIIKEWIIIKTSLGKWHSTFFFLRDFEIIGSRLFFYFLFLFLGWFGIKSLIFYFFFLFSFEYYNSFFFLMFCEEND